MNKELLIFPKNEIYKCKFYYIKNRTWIDVVDIGKMLILRKVSLVKKVINTFLC